jgi:large subunit ribosomal protein L25
MDALTLTTEMRPKGETGKGPARRLRARGLVPGVFYGPGAEPVSIAVAPKALTQVLSTPHRRNALLKLSIDGQEHLAMVKELQVHPITRAPLHLDLYKVSLEREIHVMVPFVTEGKAKGTVDGGEVNVIYRNLPVRATPDKIPPVITVDVTNMELNSHLSTKDLQLPPGVTVAFEPDRHIVTCAEPRKIAAEEEEAAAAAAAATPGAEGAAPAAAGAAAPAAAAPAAGGKAPAKG